ncbi:MAG: 2-oxo acid dehydrogenase subunit E2 [Candidatus Dormibacteraeota bacterium]|nr:2-oxo acid dehydrogenase subunit E2 [Candidatus Dormibacteraeota bacterium]
MPDVTLPKLADTLVEGTVSRWLKSPGERVARGEPLVEVETDKVNSELESPYEGVLIEIVVAEGTTVPVGEVIARIGDGGSAGEKSEVSPEPAADRRDEKASTGPATETEGRPGLSALRLRIAERMQEARGTIPQGSCSVEVDLSGGTRPGGWTASFVRAAAVAGGYSNVGVAVEVPDGLVVPVVRGAGSRDLAELSYAVRDLVERARENRLAPGDTTGGEFTVTNVGSLGTQMAFPLVNPGQPGILAPGAVIDGRCWLTLCYDRGSFDPDQAEALLERIAAELTAG